MPELVIQNYQGRNNESIEETQRRLYAQGSWKKQRIVVVIPAGAQIAAKVALSHRSLAFPPNQANTWILAEGYEVGVAFSTAIEGILAHPEISQ